MEKLRVAQLERQKKSRRWFGGRARASKATTESDMHVFERSAIELALPR